MSMCRPAFSASPGSFPRVVPTSKRFPVQRFSVKYPYLGTVSRDKSILGLMPCGYNYGPCVSAVRLLRAIEVHPCEGAEAPTPRACRLWTTSTGAEAPYQTAQVWSHRVPPLVRS